MLQFSAVQADTHGQLKFLSEYIYRGYSKSRGNPVVQAQLDYQHQSGWFTGLGVSQVSFDDHDNSERAKIEFKPQLGWNLPLNNGWHAELSVSGYLYNDKVFARHANYAEVNAGLHYQDWLSAQVSVAPNAFNRNAAVMNYELNYRRDLLDNFQFSSGLGFYQAGKLVGEDYFYWNAGISWFISPHLALDIRYVDVHLDEQHDAAHHDEFYPRPQENKYLLSVTLGF
ncbi:MAG: TorF family putative porin [Methylococcales bacterium]